MQALAAVFTPERRQAIQLWLGSLAPLLILGGFATQEQTEQYLIIAGAVLQFLAAVLSLVNVRRGDWGAGWMVVRGAVYALAATVSPALVFFGLYDANTNAALLTGISLALSSLSSLLAVFIGKSQQLTDAQHKIEVLETQVDPPNYNGELTVNMTDPTKDNYTLSIDAPWDELAKNPEVRIKVVDESDPLHKNGK